MPPVGRQAIAVSIVAGRPIASKHVSGPPSVRSRIAASVAAGSEPARRPSVAPTARASSSLAGDPIDRDDPGGAGQRGAHHARQADAAEADHDDRRAGLDVGGLRRGADAGRDAAADQRRDLRRRAVGDRDRRRGGHVLAVGERPDRAVR